MSRTNLTRFITMLVLAFLPVFAGCAGRTTIDEVYYYAVPSTLQGNNTTNYYRLTLKGDCVLGVAQYRSGYFPARAVDAFLGNVQLDKGARELELEDKLMTIIDQATVKTWENYTNEATKVTQGSQEQLDYLQQARHSILEYPGKNEIEIDYNPAGNLVTTHSNDKLVFFLASNPDEVMSRIASFAEDEKTIQSINRLSLFISEPKSTEAQVTAVQYDIQQVQLKTLAARMKQLEGELEMTPDRREQAVNELLTLLNSFSHEVKP